LPSFIELTRDKSLKSSLLVETGGGEAFVERAAAVIRQSILQTVPYRDHGGSYALMRRLHAMGYSIETVSQALARSWLEDRSEFYLPRRRKRDWLRSRPVLLAASVLVSLAGTTLFILLVRRAYPAFATVLLGLEPLLAAISRIFAIAIYWPLAKILHRSN